MSSCTNGRPKTALERAMDAQNYKTELLPIPYHAVPNNKDVVTADL